MANDHLVRSSKGTHTNCEKNDPACASDSEEEEDSFAKAVHANARQMEVSCGTLGMFFWPILPKTWISTRAIFLD